MKCSHLMKRIPSLAFLAATLLLLPSCKGQAAKQNIEKTTCEYAEKDGEKLYLDIYSDATAQQSDKAKPVFIFSFGGGWENGSRADGRKLLKECASQGYIGVGIDYRLGIRQVKRQGVAIDSTTFASSYSHAIMMGVEDLYDATRYVIDHATELNADTSRIIICGSSAGATNCLTAEYLLCNRHPSATSRLPEQFNYGAVVPFAGGVWLADADTLVWQRKPCPVLAYHGTDDPLVPFGKVVLGNGDFGGFGPDYYIPQLKAMQVSYLFHQYHRGDHLIAGWFDNEQARGEMYSELKRLLDPTQHVAITVCEEYYELAPNLGDFLKAMKKQEEQKH